MFSSATYWTVLVFPYIKIKDNTAPPTNPYIVGQDSCTFIIYWVITVSSLDDTSSDNIDVDKDHIIEFAISNSSGDDNNGNTEENQTQVSQQEQQCWDNSEVTDLSQCPPEPVQQQRQQGAAFAMAVAPLFPNPGIKLGYEKWDE